MKHFKYLVVFILLFALALPSLTVNADLAANGTVTVCIDPGHGGKDGGTDIGSKTEKEYNLTLGLYLRDALLEDGRFDVVMTRDDDTYLKYLARAQIAREANADLLISLHCNQVVESYVNGSTAYVSLIEKYNASELAGKILDSISASVNIRRGKVETKQDTGDSYGIYYWDSSAQWDMPGATELETVSDYYSMNTWCSKFGIYSILIEHGYLSNESDLSVLNSDENLKLIAKAEADAIIDYYFGHTHVLVSSVDYPSNCVFAGTVSSRCSICGAKSGTVVLDENPNGHLWKLESTLEPTCTERGEEKYICQISFNLNSKGEDCPVHEKTVTIPSLGHDYRTFVNENGGISRRCTRCGDIIHTLCSNGIEHDYAVISSTNPTCTTEGKTTYRCTLCADQFDEITPALGHSFTEKERVSPTNDCDGHITYVCDICGEEETELLPLCNHLFSVEKQDSTCDTAGFVKETCLLCGYSKSDEIAVKGHSYTVVNSQPASCTENGYSDVVCDVCGKEDRITEPATGHTFIKKGIRSVCLECGYKKTDSPLEILESHPFVIATVFIVIALAVTIIMITKIDKRRSAEKEARRDKFNSDDNGAPN